MSSIEIKILKHLRKNPSSYKDLKSIFIHQNIDSVIENLKRRGYIEPIIIGSDKFKITDEGQKYKEKLSKQRYRTVKLISAIIIPVILAILTLIFSQKPKETNIKTTINNNYLPTLEKDSTFFLKDYYLYHGLTDSIEKKSKYLNNVSSSRIIEITYSGNFVPTQEHYYYYPGGNIVIKFNGNIIYSIDTLRIEKTNPIGNLEGELKTELNNRSKRIVNNNQRLFIDEIISILNK